MQTRCAPMSKRIALTWAKWLRTCAKCAVLNDNIWIPTNIPSDAGNKELSKKNVYSRFSQKRGVVLNYKAHEKWRGGRSNQKIAGDSHAVTVQCETGVRNYSAEEFAALVCEPIEKIVKEFEATVRSYCYPCMNRNNEIVKQQRAHRLETLERVQRAQLIAKAKTSTRF